MLLLVRHGRTPFTEQRRLSGSGGADPGLSDAGRRDAEAGARALGALSTAAGVLPDVVRVDAVVCSPLRRTCQTARIIADRLALPVSPIDDWAEIGFGSWDGLTYREIADRWPAEFAAWQGSATVAPPGGQSLVDHAARVRTARAELVTGHPGRVVVVVTHATPIRCVVAEALDAGPAAQWRLRVDPASVTAVRFWVDGGVEVLAVNRAP